MVLYVFVVAYIGGADKPLHRPGGALKVLAPLFGLAVAIELCIAMLGTALKGVSSEGAPYVPGFGTPEHIGKLFLTTYLFPFEIASLLLLVAAIGAVVLARRRRGLEPDEAYETRLHAARSVFTGTMAEAAGFREGAGTTTDDHEQTEPIGAQRPPHLRAWAAPATRAGAGDGHRLVPDRLGADLLHRRRRRLTRPNPLVILLCLELMLNAGNLALVAFSRMWGHEDGQVFALIVMVVAACEVTVGLGLIVAIYRRQLPVNVDDLSELSG